LHRLANSMIQHKYTPDSILGKNNWHDNYEMFVTHLFRIDQAYKDPTSI